VRSAPKRLVGWGLATSTLTSSYAADEVLLPFLEEEKREKKKKKKGEATRNIEQDLSCRVRLGPVNVRPIRKAVWGGARPALDSR